MDFRHWSWAGLAQPYRHRAPDKQASGPGLISPPGQAILQAELSLYKSFTTWIRKVCPPKEASSLIEDHAVGLSHCTCWISAQSTSLWAAPHCVSPLIPTQRQHRTGINGKTGLYASVYNYTVSHPCKDLDKYVYGHVCVHTNMYTYMFVSSPSRRLPCQCSEQGAECDHSSLPGWFSSARGKILQDLTKRDARKSDPTSRDQITMPSFRCLNCFAWDLSECCKLSILPRISWHYFP